MANHEDDKERRACLAANLLQDLAEATPIDRWVNLAEKALAAATIIYPDPKETE